MNSTGSCLGIIMVENGMKQMRPLSFSKQSLPWTMLLLG